MTAAARDRKDIWMSIFRRKGKTGVHVRPFDALDSAHRETLLGAVRLLDSELPVIGSVQTPDDWFALTTDRLIWSIAGKRKELQLADLRHATGGFKTPEEKRSSQMLQVLTRSGDAHVIELEAGAPLFGVWHILLNIAQRNRGVKKGMR